MEELEKYVDDLGFIGWENFAPQENILVIKTIKQQIKMRTATGIFVGSGDDQETIAPNMGLVISAGPECKKDLVGKVVFYPAQSVFPLAMIRPEESGETYQMCTEDRIDGILVKDVNS